jgi:cyclin B
MLSAGALHAPRTRSQARAAAAQQQQQQQPTVGGVVAASSLSSLLASRAAAAAAAAPAPPPPAPAPPTDDISSRQQNQQRQRSAGRAATASLSAAAQAAAGAAAATAAAALAPAAAPAQHPPALAPLPPAGPPPSSSGAAAARRPHPFLPADPPRGPLPDIDAPDRHNPMAAADYADALYSHYRRAERQFRVDPSYMRLVQRDVNEKMRAILVDWLVEVHLKFKLMPETLFLTTSLIDRFLACTPVSRKRLQLVGVTAMLVASKYEEIWAPEVRDFVYISDKAYDRAQILGMEREMLSALGYRLTLPTSYQFLARLLKAASAHYDKKLALFVAYCAELCLVEYSTLRYSPSELAAGVMYVAMRAMGRDDPFPPRLAAHAAVPGKTVLAAAKDVVRIVARAPSASLTAVHRKYSSPKFMEAAKVPAPMEILEE